MIWVNDYGHDIIIWLWSLTINWPELPLFRGHLELRRCCCFLIFISVYEPRYKRRSCYIQPHSDWKKARIWFSYKFKLVVFSQYIPLSLLRRQAIESTVYGLISTYRISSICVHGYIWQNVHCLNLPLKRQRPQNKIRLISPWRILSPHTIYLSFTQQRFFLQITKVTWYSNSLCHLPKKKEKQMVEGERYILKTKNEIN